MSTAMGTALFVVGVVLAGLLLIIVRWARRDRTGYRTRSRRHPYDTWYRH